jgi:hypothetical protein
MMQWNTTGDIKIGVCHHSWLDGGGTWFGQEYVDEISKRYPGRRFKKCYEWCSGPGFIGFNLLSHGICDSLCLSDRYEPAIECVQHTVKQHSLSDRVSCYASDTVGNIPGHEQFDLVVANPPHYLECPGDENYQRIAVDHDWQAHNEFFKNIGFHLTDDGIILLQENQAGSIKGPAGWADMIDRNGLTLTAYWSSPRWFDSHGPTQIYYMEIQKANKSRNNH